MIYLLENFHKKVLMACNLIKKRLQLRFFPMNIVKFLRTHILKNICKLLLLILKVVKFEEKYISNGEVFKYLSLLCQRNLRQKLIAIVAKTENAPQRQILSCCLSKTNMQGIFLCFTHSRFSLKFKY